MRIIAQLELSQLVLLPRVNVKARAKGLMKKLSNKVPQSR